MASTPWPGWWSARRHAVISFAATLTAVRTHHAKEKAPPFDGAKFGGAFGLDGHGVILIVAVAFGCLRFHVLGIHPDRRQGVEHGVRQPLVKQGIVLILGQNSSNFGAIGDP